MRFSLILILTGFLFVILTVGLASDAAPVVLMKNILTIIGSLFLIWLIHRAIEKVERS